MHASATSLPPVSQVPINPPHHPVQKEHDRASKRLHNFISDLIGLIIISPVCAEHTLPLASHSNTKPPSLLTVVTIPRRFRHNRPLRETAHFALSTHHPQSRFRYFRIESIVTGSTGLVCAFLLYSSRIEAIPISKS